MTNIGNVTPSENTGFEPLPAGKYLAAIIEDELKDNSKGTGQHLHLAWQILEGRFTGRQVFQNVTLKHDNPQAEEVGKKQIAQICFAIGHSGGVNVDSADFHGKPALISLIIKTDDGYAPSNEIKRIERAGTAVPPQSPSGPAVPDPGASAAGNGNAPWR